MPMTPKIEPQAALSTRRICGVSRVNGLIRGSLIACGAVVLIAPAVLAWPALSFRATPTSSRLVDFSLAFVVVLPLLAGVYVAWRAVRWIALAVWPGPLGVNADGEALTLALGPFGRWRLEWRRMDVTYSFEREDDPDEEPDPELLALDEEEEMAARLPRMLHPDVERTVNALLERFAVANEAALAQALRPFLRRARGEDAESKT
ncbi:MAG: hypothetical protein L0271_26365 [Gemmatimonadetes bacterium]|nr:hypothetical protein [Gemmatimonadota bacterium]